jgi:hypothetical protein
MDGTHVEEFEPPVIVRVARTMDDMQRISVVRALVYMSEQDCPYDEEFDGNDLAGATHLLAEAGGEPLAACGCAGSPTSPRSSGSACATGIGQAGLRAR